VTTRLNSTARDSLNSTPFRDFGDTVSLRKDSQIERSVYPRSDLRWLHLLKSNGTYPESAAIIAGVHEFYHGTSYDRQSVGHKYNIISKRRTTVHLKNKWRVLTNGWRREGIDIWEDEEQGDLIPELVGAAREVWDGHRLRLRQPLRTRDLVAPHARREGRRRR
jgi:hypothetical protein